MITAKSAVEEFLTALSELGTPPFEVDEVPDLTIAASNMILYCLNEPDGVIKVVEELKLQSNLIDTIDDAIKLNVVLEMFDGMAIGLALDGISAFLQLQVNKLK